jgi:fatty acid-binding protein DegV
MLESMSGVKVELITGIGPVIGSHAGPGTIALFFLGKER